MGREEAKAQSKEAQQAKEKAAFEKKQAQRDKQWEVGAKDTSGDAAAAAKAAEAAARRAERKAIEEEEGAMGKSTKPKKKDDVKKGPTKAEKAQRALLAAQVCRRETCRTPPRLLTRKMSLDRRWRRRRRQRRRRPRRMRRRQQRPVTLPLPPKELESSRSVELSVCVSHLVPLNK